MQKPFFEQLNSLGYLNKKILVAVSGGLDSIVLLDLFVHAGCEVGVAHANFQLRGEESDKDEAFVIQLGARYQVPVFVKLFDTKNYATEPFRKFTRGHHLFPVVIPHGGGNSSYPIEVKLQFSIS